MRSVQSIGRFGDMEARRRGTRGATRGRMPRNVARRWQPRVFSRSPFAIINFAGGEHSEYRRAQLAAGCDVWRLWSSEVGDGGGNIAAARKSSSRRSRSAEQAKFFVTRHRRTNCSFCSTPRRQASRRLSAASRRNLQLIASWRRLAHKRRENKYTGGAASVASRRNSARRVALFSRPLVGHVIDREQRRARFHRSLLGWPSFVVAAAVARRRSPPSSEAAAAAASGDERFGRRTHISATICCSTNGTSFSAPPRVRNLPHGVTQTTTKNNAEHQHEHDRWSGERRQRKRTCRLACGRAAQPTPSIFNNERR